MLISFLISSPPFPRSAHLLPPIPPPPPSLSSALWQSIFSKVHNILHHHIYFPKRKIYTLFIYKCSPFIFFPSLQFLLPLLLPLPTMHYSQACARCVCVCLYLQRNKFFRPRPRRGTSMKTKKRNEWNVLRFMISVRQCWQC